MNPSSSSSSLSATDFEILRHVGAGNFSDVFHVELKRSGQSYALKKLSKATLKRLRKEREALMEKHCLLKLHREHVTEDKHPGQDRIIKLHYTFHDQENLYLVMDFCHYGELWEIVSGIGILDQTLGLYFIAQLIQAVEFCHLNGIVHRDLKAENILMTKEGTLKLIDFGTAIDLHSPHIKPAGNQSRGGKGKIYENFVGTAEFMAPEALKNQASGFAVDLWSLGCTIYQILAGLPPFPAPTEFLSYLLSTTLDYTFPPHFPEAAADLVRKLLVLDPEQRLGAGSLSQNRGLEDIKRHPYFSGVDFRHLESLVSGRPIFPPLQDSCLSHMAKHWDRYREKWQAHGWLTPDGQLPPLQPETTSVATETVQEDDGRVWMHPAPPVNLEVQSRQLLAWEGARRSPRLRCAQERLLFLKTFTDPTGVRNQAFWDKRVADFLKTSKERQSAEQ